MRALGEGPVAVGGVGGSGTRVVAQFVRGLGFYIGDDLNRALDNLWFTLLFKRPAWYRRSGRGLDSGLRVFQKAMTGARSLSPVERVFLLRATFDVALHGHDHERHGHGTWALQRARSLQRARGPSAQELGWAWKEPNTHVFLDPLTRSLGGLRYIHVIRHGVEMAYSGNQFQLFNWGPLFGVEPPAESAAVPAASLRYWVRANGRAIELGRRRLGERFLLLRYEAICSDPCGSIRSISRFLGVEPDAATVDELAALVRAPRRAERSARAGSAPFAAEDLEATERLGFEV